MSYSPSSWFSINRSIKTLQTKTKQYKLKTKTQKNKNTKKQQEKKNIKQGKALVKILNLVGGIALYFDSQRNCFKSLFKLAIASWSILLSHNEHNL